MDVKGIWLDDVDWIHLVQDKNQWQFSDDGNDPSMSIRWEKRPDSLGDYNLFKKHSTYSLELAGNTKEKDEDKTRKRLVHLRLKTTLLRSRGVMGAL
jgi:hypothetical protein